MNNSDAMAVQVPQRYSRVVAWVISADTDAEIAFLHRVFGATEAPGSRVMDAQGRIGHAEVEIGDAVIMLFDAPMDWPATPAHLRVYVDNVHRAFDQALRAGARPVTEPTDLPFGDRVARVRDPQGHLWWIHEHIEDVDPAQLPSRTLEPQAGDSVAYVQESLTEEMRAASEHRPT